MEKKIFVETTLLSTLQAIDERIESAYYNKFENGEEFVHVNVKINSYKYDTIVICVTADSLLAIVTDVFKRLF